MQGSTTADDCIDCAAGGCDAGLHGARMGCDDGWTYWFDLQRVELVSSCIAYTANKVVWDVAVAACPAARQGSHLLTSRQVLLHESPLTHSAVPGIACSFRDLSTV